MFKNNDIEQGGYSMKGDDSMKCFTCDELTNDYETDKKTCAACKELFKIDLVRLVLGLDPVYLSESNRNNKGRKPKLTATEMNDIKSAYENPLEYGKTNMRALAKKYKVSVGTISRIVHKQGF